MKFDAVFVSVKLHAEGRLQNSQLMWNLFVDGLDNVDRVVDDSESMAH